MHMDTSACMFSGAIKPNETFGCSLHAIEERKYLYKIEQRDKVKHGSSSTRLLSVEYFTSK